MSKCPSCGYCEHCGRRDAAPIKVGPFTQPWINPYPNTMPWVSPNQTYPPPTYTYVNNVTCH